MASAAELPEGVPPRHGLQAEVAAFTLRALQTDDVDETVDAAVTAVRSALRGAIVELVRAPAAAKAPASGDEHRSVAPVLVEGAAWAHLVVTAPRRPLHADEVRFVAMITLVLGAAVERDRSARRRIVVDDLETFVERTRDAATVATAAAQAGAAVTLAPSCLVVRVVPRTRTAVVVASSDALDEDVGRRYELDPLLAVALCGPDTLIGSERDGTAAPQSWPLPPGRPSCAYLAVPVLVRGVPWGRVVATSPEPRAWTDAERAAARTVATVVAAALDRTSERDLDAAPGTEVALLDRDGVIVWVNEAWERFSRENGGDPARTGVGASYLAPCDAADDVTARDVAAAVRSALRGELPAPVAISIPCRTPDALRWFDVLVSSRYDDDGRSVGASVTLSPGIP